MAQYGYSYPGGGYAQAPYAPQMMPQPAPPPPPPPPPLTHHAVSDSYSLVPHSRRPQLYTQDPALHRAQSQQAYGYSYTSTPITAPTADMSNNRWAPRQDAYLPSSPISYAPRPYTQQSAYVDLQGPPALPSQPYSQSAPQSYFPAPPSSAPPPIPPKSRRHSRRSTDRPSVVEQEGFLPEKPGNGSHAAAPPLIRVLSQSGETVELDEDQALALAIERSLTVNYGERAIPPEYSLDEDWNRRNSATTSESTHGPRTPASPVAERTHPALMTTPTASSTSSVPRHRASADSFQSSFYSPLSPHDRTSVISFTSDTSATAATARADAGPSITSLPSSIIVPGKPNVYRLVGDSVQNLLKQLIAQADVQLEASPAVFHGSTSEAPEFKLVCYVRGWKRGAEGNPQIGYAEEPQKRRSSGSSTDDRDVPFCTVVNLQAEEVTMAHNRNKLGVTTQAGAPVGAWGDTIDDPAATIDERGLRIDFGDSLLLPLRMSTLVERLHAMLQQGKTESRRQNPTLTVEAQTALALHKFVQAHPGQYNPEDLLRKINKTRMKVAPPELGKGGDGDAPADEGGLLGQEKRQGKRFLARKVTSKVIGKLQGHRHDIEEDGREDWITPFMPTKEEM